MTTPTTDSMTTTTPTDANPDLAGLATRIEAAFASGSAAAWAACFAEDAVQVHPFFPAPNVGRAAIEAAESALFDAFEDVALTVTCAFAGDGRAALEMRVTARNTGPIAQPDGSAIPATGRTVDLTMASIVRLDDRGLIVEEHRYQDNLAFLRQLGIV